MKSLKRIVTGRDELGAYEFDDGSVLFWTSGRGGFVVEGGLGYWPNNPNFRQDMIDAAQIAEDWANCEFGTGVNPEFLDLDGFYQLPPDLMQKAREAAQSPWNNRKYSLTAYLEKPIERANVEG